MTTALLQHWPEYGIEGTLLGAFMFAACAATVCVEHPGSFVRRRIASGLGRRAIIGVLMGLTAVALIHSPLGRRSGAHMNPAVTLTYLALGKVRAWDAVFYVSAQIAGGLAGVLLSVALLGRRVAHPSVAHVVTVPGRWGRRGAFAGEAAISFVMMGVVLAASNDWRAAPYTGLCAGALLALFITFEAPCSGMSLNPARTLASAIPAGEFRGLWVYCTAPVLGMLLAAGVYTAASGGAGVGCTKLNHSGASRRIVRCERVSRAEQPRGTCGIEGARGMHDERAGGCDAVRASALRRSRASGE